MASRKFMAEIKLKKQKTKTKNPKELKKTLNKNMTRLQPV